MHLYSLSKALFTPHPRAQPSSMTLQLLSHFSPWPLDASLTVGIFGWLLFRSFSGAKLQAFSNKPSSLNPFNLENPKPSNFEVLLKNREPLTQIQKHEDTKL